LLLLALFLQTAGSPVDSIQTVEPTTHRQGPILIY
jgi:hypothetical protein